MRVLFIGGNGNISWYCVQKAIEAGHEVWALNRGATLKTRRAIQPQVHRITGDIRDAASIGALLPETTFDVVCDFICFNEENARQDIALFRERTKQFIFISSEAVYKRKNRYLPFREDAERDLESTDGYISGKLRAEQIFLEAFHRAGFPVTIVRPAYTYDVIIPVSIGHNCFTAPQRFLNGDPVLIAGEGNNLWTFTHSRDFAGAFVALFGKERAIGEDFHIMSDEWLSWNDVAEIVLDKLGVRARRLIHIPFEEALGINVFHSREMMRQRMLHNIYDTSKIKKIAPGWRAETPFEQGIGETLRWLYEADVRRRIVPRYDEALSLLYRKYA